MSVQKLISLNEKATAYTYSEVPVYLTGPSKYEEKTFSCTPPVLSLSTGSNTSITMSWSSDEVHMIEDLYLEWTATNSSATEAPTFYNPFLTLHSAKLFINGTEKSYIKDPYQIVCKVSDYFKSCGNEHKLFNEFGKITSNVLSTAAQGEQVAVSSTLPFSLNLFILFPELKNLVVNLSGIYKLQFDFQFAINTSSLSNTFFVLSNTTSNAYGSNLTYSNIELRSCIRRHTDARMYKNLNAPSAMISSHYDTKIFPNIAWNTVNGNEIKINIANDFTKRTRIMGVTVFLFDHASATAYNSAGCCVLNSYFQDIGFEIKSRSNSLLDLKSNSLSHKLKRRRYLQKFNENRFGQDIYRSVNNGSDSDPSFAKYIIMNTYIDLAGVICDADKDALVYSGINNYENDIELSLYCTTAVSANVTLYIMLNYMDMSYIDQKSKQLKFIE